jgi:lysophospholipase L1-like esterase
MNFKIVLLIFGLFSLSINAQTKLYLIGDSTMSDKRDPELNPETGWGQVLPQFFNDQISIENHAVNGRSTKSFIDEGRWQKVYQKLQERDYVFIQFGHNDQKATSPNRFTNPTTAYRSNLAFFINQTRSKGAIPVLFTSLVRRNYNKDHSLVDTHGLYPVIVRLLANELNVPLIDLQSLSETLVLSYGEEESKTLYLHFKRKEHPYFPKGKKDNTHLSRLGALKVATLVVAALKEKKLLENYMN